MVIEQSSQSRKPKLLAGLGLAILTAFGVGNLRPIQDWRELITCVPRHDMLRYVEPSVRQHFPELLAISEADTWKLLESDNARDRGIGLFVLDRRGDVRGLVRCVEMVNDQRPTIDDSGVSAALLHFVSAPQDLGSYYVALCSKWLGIQVGRPEEVRRIVQGIADPEALAWPWSQRLARASYDGRESGNRSEFDAVRARVRGLPPEQRLIAVLGASERMNVYSEEEAVQDIGELPEPLLAAIRAGDDTPFLKVYAHDSARAFTRGIGEQYSKLLERVAAAKDAPNKSDDQAGPDQDANPKK